MKSSIFLSLVLMLLTACAGRQTEPEASQVSTEPVGTASPLPTDTSAPTTTPQPSPTGTPAPTSTPRAEPEPTPTDEPATLFAFVGEDPSQPVVTSHPTGLIDNLYINPGGMLFHDGRFHMFFNSFSDWPGTVIVGYLTSTDGLNWTPVQDEPVFSTDEIPYVIQGADVSSVAVLEDGVWALYFHTVQASPPSEVGRATADSPLGPWQVDPKPLLSPGGQGEWDNRGLAWPSVVKTGNGYAMYYAGKAVGGKTQIGLATSEDGRSWVKHDDPATTEAPYAESDPVLVAAHEWERGSLDRMRVVGTPDGYAMFYQGGPLIHRGLAFSDDGVNWITHPDNPIITSLDFPVRGNTWDTAFVYHEGVFRYYMEIGDLSGTNLYLAVHEGPLAP